MATKVENEDSSVAFAVRLMQHLVVPTFVLDDQRRVIIWNRACERLTGVRSAEVIGTRDQWRGFYEAPRYCLADLVALGRAEQLGDLYEAHTVHDDSSLGLCAEVWCVMPCVGKRLYLAVDAGPIYDEDGKLIAVVETLRDMTEQKLAQTALQGLHLADKDALEHEILERTEVQKQLVFAAFHDELTGLSNRAFPLDRLNELVAKKHAGSHFWAILFLDLDRFKAINDSLGHIVGDLVLVEVARRLERCLRSGDTLVRLGGDEFVILLEDIEDVEAACDVARRVEHSLGVPFTVAGRGIFASARIGIATSLIITATIGPKTFCAMPTSRCTGRSNSASSAMNSSPPTCSRAPSRGWKSRPISCKRSSGASSGSSINRSSRPMRPA